MNDGMRNEIKKIGKQVKKNIKGRLGTLGIACTVIGSIGNLNISVDIQINNSGVIIMCLVIVIIAAIVATIKIWKLKTQERLITIVINKDIPSDSGRTEFTYDNSSVKKTKKHKG